MKEDHAGTSKSKEEGCEVKEWHNKWLHKVRFNDKHKEAGKKQRTQCRKRDAHLSVCHTALRERNPQHIYRSQTSKTTTGENTQTHPAAAHVPWRSSTADTTHRNGEQCVQSTVIWTRQRRRSVENNYPQLPPFPTTPPRRCRYCGDQNARVSWRSGHWGADQAALILIPTQSFSEDERSSCWAVGIQLCFTGVPIIVATVGTCESNHVHSPDFIKSRPFVLLPTTGSCFHYVWVLFVTSWMCRWLEQHDTQTVWVSCRCDDVLTPDQPGKDGHRSYNCARRQMVTDHFSVWVRPQHFGTRLAEEGWVTLHHWADKGWSSRGIGDWCKWMKCNGDDKSFCWLVHQLDTELVSGFVFNGAKTFCHYWYKEEEMLSWACTVRDNRDVSSYPVVYHIQKNDLSCFFHFSNKHTSSVNIKIEQNPPKRRRMQLIKTRCASLFCLLYNEILSCVTISYQPARPVQSNFMVSPDEHRPDAWGESGSETSLTEPGLLCMSWVSKAPGSSLLINFLCTPDFLFQALWMFVSGASFDFSVQHGPTQSCPPGRCYPQSYLSPTWTLSCGVQSSYSICTQYTQ